jgi:uncharacterized membrane protein (UPF0127 family)
LRPLAAALACALLIGSAPGGPPFAGPRPAAEGLIRPDAVVEFLRPDGSVAARLVVEIAESPETRAAGLMFRELADFTAGMLFVFERSEPQRFWMRNTPTSLDMIFVDDQARVINIAARTTPMSDRVYSSAAPARLVVEARAGFAERFGIREGAAVRWRRLRQ